MIRGVEAGVVHGCATEDVLACHFGPYTAKCDWTGRVRVCACCLLHASRGCGPMNWRTTAACPRHLRAPLHAAISGRPNLVNADRLLGYRDPERANNVDLLQDCRRQCSASGRIQRAYVAGGYDSPSSTIISASIRSLRAAGSLRTLRCTRCGYVRVVTMKFAPKPA